MSKPSLHELRNEAARLEQVFEDECYGNGYKDRWDAYKAEQAGEVLPESVTVAHDAWIKALHDFYEARDGVNGFLGRTKVS